MGFFYYWYILTTFKKELSNFSIRVLNPPFQYLDFADIFLKKPANVFSKRISDNKHMIKLKDGKQPPYGPIYSLEPVELETLKTYIESNLANSFIQVSKLLTGTLILFVHKLNGSFCLCVNYQRPNNLTIKNRYLLLLIGKSLNRLGQAKRFIQLDFTSAYYWIRIKEDNEWKTVF